MELILPSHIMAFELDHVLKKETIAYYNKVNFQISQYLNRFRKINFIQNPILNTKHDVINSDSSGQKTEKITHTTIVKKREFFDQYEIIKSISQPYDEVTIILKKNCYLFIFLTGNLIKLVNGSIIRFDFNICIFFLRSLQKICRREYS